MSLSRVSGIKFDRDRVLWAAWLEKGKLSVCFANAPGLLALSGKTAETVWNSLYAEDIGTLLPPGPLSPPPPGPPDSDPAGPGGNWIHKTLQYLPALSRMAGSLTPIVKIIWQHASEHIHHLPNILSEKAPELFMEVISLQTDIGLLADTAKSEEDFEDVDRDYHQLVNAYEELEPYISSSLKAIGEEDAIRKFIEPYLLKEPEISVTGLSSAITVEVSETNYEQGSPAKKGEKKQLHGDEAKAGA